MTEAAFSPLPLDFHVRVPCDQAFASIVIELAGRLAKVAGFDEGRCTGIGREVGEAFSRNVQDSVGAAGPMDLAMRVTAGAFSADMGCGATRLLSLTWPRPA